MFGSSMQSASDRIPAPTSVAEAALAAARKNKNKKVCISLYMYACMYGFSCIVRVYLF